MSRVAYSTRLCSRNWTELLFAVKSIIVVTGQSLSTASLSPSMLRQEEASTEDQSGLACAAFLLYTRFQHEHHLTSQIADRL